MQTKHLKKVIFIIVIKVIGVIIFLISWVVGFISLIYFAKEGVGIKKFTPSVFLNGNKVINLEEPIVANRTSINKNNVGKTKSGEFMFVSDKVCFFRRKIEVFGGTSFILKGRLILNNEIVNVTGRLPMGSYIALLAMTVGIVNIGIVLLVIDTPIKEKIIPMIMVIFGFAIGKLLFKTSVNYEKNELMKVYNEIKYQIEH